jgi:hypothetical protein
MPKGERAENVGEFLSLKLHVTAETRCWKTSPQQYHVMRLAGGPLGRNLTNQTTSTVRSKFLEISSTTYIENKQYIEF